MTAGAIPSPLARGQAIPCTTGVGSAVHFTGARQVGGDNMRHGPSHYFYRPSRCGRTMSLIPPGDTGRARGLLRAASSSSPCRPGHICGTFYPHTPAGDPHRIGIRSACHVAVQQREEAWRASLGLCLALPLVPRPTVPHAHTPGIQSAPELTATSRHPPFWSTLRWRYEGRGLNPGHHAARRPPRRVVAPDPAIWLQRRAAPRRMCSGSLVRTLPVVLPGHFHRCVVLCVGQCNAAVHCPPCAQRTPVDPATRRLVSAADHPPPASVEQHLPSTDRQLRVPDCLNPLHAPGQSTRRACHGRSGTPAQCRGEGAPHREPLRNVRSCRTRPRQRPSRCSDRHLAPLTRDCARLVAAEAGAGGCQGFGLHGSPARGPARSPTSIPMAMASTWASVVRPVP